MASTGKKNKKSKGKSVSLQAFLANGNTQPGVTQVAKKVRNRFDESDEEDSHSLPQIYQLPTAPRSTRFFDDDLIPQKPPFQAYISNLPFDVRDEDIYEFFGDLDIASLRLPREDGESGRLRGFGYIEFGNRDDLISAVRMPDPQIRNRRIRIDISNDSDNKRGGNNRSRFDGFGSSEGRESNNWRTNDNKRDGDGRRGGYGYNRDRQRDNSQEGGGGGGSWRSTDRPNTDSSPVRRSGFGDGFRGDRDRERYGGRRDDYKRSEEPPTTERPKLNLKPRTLPLPEIVTQSEDKDEESEEKPSTPEPPKSKPAGVAAEKVFGSARPVDTAAREKQIEERRQERERQEKQRKQDEEKDKEKEDDNLEEKLEETDIGKDEKENKNTTSWRNRDADTRPDDDHSYRKYSPDRRGPPRRNDDRRGGGGINQQRDNRDNRDNRDGQRDRRDYNRGYDRDNNKYRDNRDRNERSDRDRDQFNRDRERASFNKDTKNPVRDTKPKEEKPRKETRPDKPMPKYQPPQGGPVLSNVNKYSVFLDEDDASE